MTSDYEELRQKNIEEYGKGSRHLSYFADIYSTRTHFIYEILQNAEDALLRRSDYSLGGYVDFRLFEDRLEIRHNGAPFSQQDVIGICGIGEGTKSGDYTQIGKFGIGFKSVYAYSFFPKIHSGNEHFAIHRFVEPHIIDPVESDETLIILPFDQPDNRPQWAFRGNVSTNDAVNEIGVALRQLNIRTMLFLKHIDEIRWSLPDGKTGCIHRYVEHFDHGRKARVHDQNGMSEEWCVFPRTCEVIDDGQAHTVDVEVAFLIRNGHVVRADNSELVVYFPTEKETKLGFLIQAPFKTTKARDNIKSDDSANRRIIEEAAQLAAESLDKLRDLNLLNLASYSALPIREQDFPMGSLFRPVYDRVRKAFQLESLLPAHDGSFICASDSKLARGKELVDLFSSEQLSQLFGKDRLTWLDPAITESGSNADFHTFLTGKKKWLSKTEWDMAPLCEGIEVTPESLALKLTSEFLAEQYDDWLLCFIPFAMEGAKALKTTPFVRLDDGKHVALPPDNAADRPAWFAPEDVNGVEVKGFPLVHAPLARDGKVRKLLETNGIREIDAAAIVERSILPLYDGKRAFDEQEYRSHLRQIAKALRKANESAKKQLTSKLEQFQWLACIHASGSRPDVVWKNHGSSDIYCNATEIETWFRNLHDVEAFFPLPLVEQELGNEFLNVVNPHSKLTRMLFLTEKDEKLSPKSGAPHRRGLNGFNPDAKIVGLQEALNDWNMERALILWNIMLEAPRIISGETQSETNRQRLDAAPKKYELSEVGKLCRNYSCLPDKHGGWHKPSELFLADLPDSFAVTSVRAKEVADKLGMKKPEVEEATEKLSRGDPRKKKLLEQIANASEEELGRFEKLVPTSLPPQPFPSFKDGLNNMHRSQRGSHSSPNDHPQEIDPVSNPSRYQDKLDERVDASFQEHVSNPRTISFSPVRDRPDNKEAREFLYQEYQGHCQMTGVTFPKASADTDGNALNYFEVCSLLPYSNADYLNDAGNMLCLSADSTAKLRHASFEWLDDVEEKITEFESGGSIAQEVRVNIIVAGEECSITWKQRHFMRLVALYSPDRKEADA